MDLVNMNLIVNGLVAAAVAIAAAYVFVKTLQYGFTKALLAVSVLIDFYLIILWLLGIDRPLYTIYFARLNTSITITALTLFIPLKLVFTIYLFTRQRSLAQALS